MPLPGEQVWRRRARDALKRDGNLLEGALGSRSRRGLARGGVQPPSEAESHPRGRPTLERGGTLPEGRPALERGEFVSVRRRTPRAKWSSARGWLRPIVWWAVGSWVCLARVFYEFKRGFPGCLGDPSRLSPTVAPEHLWVYPLGSRRC
jgi:hypothetical protein